MRNNMARLSLVAALLLASGCASPAAAPADQSASPSVTAPTEASTSAPAVPPVAVELMIVVSDLNDDQVDCNRGPKITPGLNAGRPVTLLADGAIVETLELETALAVGFMCTYSAMFRTVPGDFETLEASFQGVNFPDLTIAHADLNFGGGVHARWLLVNKDFGYPESS